MNSVTLPSLFVQIPPGPESPDENKTETPRAPSCMKPLQTEIAISLGQVCMLLDISNLESTRDADLLIFSVRDGQCLRKLAIWES